MFAKIAESKWMKFVLFLTTFAFVGTAFVAIVVYKFAGNISGAALVNGREISLQEFYYQVNTIQNRLESQGIDTAPLKREIYDQALEAVIDRELLYQQAEKEGIAATNEEVKKAILDIEAFQENGKFSKDKYIALLSSMNLSPQLFEEIVRKDLSAQHIFSLIDVSFYLSDDEVDSYVSKQLSKISGIFLKINPPEYKPSEKDLKAYYESHKDQFKGKIGKEIIIYRIDIEKTGIDKADNLARDLFLKLKNNESDIKNSEIQIIFKDVVYDFNVIGNIPKEVKEKLKELNKNKNIVFVKTDDAYYLSKFIREVSEPLPFAKVKDQISEKLKEEYKKGSVERLYKEISSSEIDLKKLSQKYKVKGESVKSLPIRDILVKYNLTPDKMSVFLKDKKGVLQLTDGVLVYKIDKVSPPDADEKEALIKIVKPILENEKYNTLVQMYIDKLRKNSDIKRNERIFR
ncbi:peptidylprolyl isomerase [Persephonella sp.]